MGKIDLHWSVKMEINYFDVVVATIILLLGLKGILNGFFKELFGLIGIIGGIFVASRVGDSVGEYLSNLAFHFSNHAAISFTGFIVTLAVFWIVMIAIGYLFNKMSHMSGLGLMNRLFGFIFGAGKFFLIAAIIAFAINNVQAIKPTLQSASKNSILFPILVQAGGFIMKIDTTDFGKDVNKKLQQTTHEVSKTIHEKATEIGHEAIKNSFKEKEQEIKEAVTQEDAQEPQEKEEHEEVKTQESQEEEATEHKEKSSEEEEK